MSGANLDRAVGKILGDRYQLLTRIGSGASAEVYQATDLRLGRSVAVKQIRAGLTEDHRFAKLFRSEAQLAAKLSHPNILTVLDWSADPEGRDDGAYIVTELLAGGTLRSVLDVEGTISLSQAAYIGLQAARGLAFAHEQGLVHRDIKPANLMFGADGRIHIGDFGIARAVAEAAWTEPEGVLIGTARYAAPEQATSGAVNGLVDVYSLTVCLMEALTGEVPHVRENALGTMLVRQSEDLPVDGSFGVLAEPLAWAGVADPAERATAAELRDALLVVCRSLPDPDPLILIDLTESVGPPRADGGPPPNVRFNDDGELIIAGDDSDLALASEDQSSFGFDRDPEAYYEQDFPQGWGDDPDDYEADYETPHLRRDRRWLVWTAAFLALAAGSVVGGWFLAQSRQPEVEQITIGFPSYPVEDYQGLTPTEIEAAVADNAWTVVVAEEYSDDVARGRLISQRPVPGTMMAPGGQIELVVSLGPVRRVVPEMVGRNQDDVTGSIEAANLRVGSVSEQFDEAVEPGVVLDATIDGVAAQPGTEFATGTVIDLLVSSGPAPRIVPPLIGLSVEAARVALADRALELDVVEAFSQSVGEGLIISIEPGAESSVARGSTVTATVSLGKPFVEVPNMVDRLVSEAIVELQEQGFSVRINGTVGQVVIATRPQSGERVRLGSEIEIISNE